MIQSGPVIAHPHQASHFIQHSISEPDSQLCPGQNIHQSGKDIFLYFCMKKQKGKKKKEKKSVASCPEFLAAEVNRASSMLLCNSGRCHHRQFLLCLPPTCHSLAPSSRNYNPRPAGSVAFITEQTVWQGVGSVKPLKSRQLGSRLEKGAGVSIPP